MKKHFPFPRAKASLAFLIALLTVFPAQADVTPDQLTFTETEDGYCVTRFSGHLAGALTIPDTHNGKPVVAIGPQCFDGCDGLTSVTLGRFVTSIGNWAFWNCTGLTGVTLGPSVASVGYYAFEGCTGLPRISIPRSVSFIGLGALAGCSGLTQIDVEEGNPGYCSVDGILYDRTIEKLICYPAGLQERKIPETVTTLGSYAFSGCTGLTHISIPRTVTTIEPISFHYCSGLTQIDVQEENPNYCSVDGILYDKPAKRLICCPAGRQAFVNIPGTVTTVGAESFFGCSRLTAVHLPGTVTSIEFGAFASSGLTRVEIPDAVAEIDTCAFTACGNLAHVTLGKGVKTIRSQAFSQCHNLQTITCLRTTAPSAPANIFEDGTYDTATLYVPEGSTNNFRRHGTWKKFRNIVGKNLAGIGAPEAGEDHGAAEVYRLDGKRVPASAERLRPGNYIVRQGKHTKKIHVR